MITSPKEHMNYKEELSEEDYRQLVGTEPKIADEAEEKPVKKTSKKK